MFNYALVFSIAVSVAYNCTNPDSEGRGEPKDTTQATKKQPLEVVDDIKKQLLKVVDGINIPDHVKALASRGVQYALGKGTITESSEAEQVLKKVNAILRQIIKGDFERLQAQGAIIPPSMYVIGIPSTDYAIPITETVVRYQYPRCIIEHIFQQSFSRDRGLCTTPSVVKACLDHPDSKVALFVIGSLSADDIKRLKYHNNVDLWFDLQIRDNEKNVPIIEVLLDKKVPMNASVVRRYFRESSHVSALKAITQHIRAAELDKQLSDNNRKPTVALVIRNDNLSSTEKVSLIQELFIKGATPNWHTSLSDTDCSYLKEWYSCACGTGKRPDLFVLEVLLAQKDLTIDRKDIQQVLVGIAQSYAGKYSQDSYKVQWKEALLKILNSEKISAEQLREKYEVKDVWDSKEGKTFGSIIEEYWDDDKKDLEKVLKKIGFECSN